MQREAKSSSLCSASYIAVNTTLLAFAADGRAAADVDRKAAARPRLLQTRRAAIDRYRLSAGPTAANPLHAVAAAQDEADKQTDTVSLHNPAAYYASSVKNENICGSAPITSKRSVLLTDDVAKTLQHKKQLISIKLRLLCVANR